MEVTLLSEHHHTSDHNHAARLFLAVFLLFCLLPSVGMLIFGSSKAGANEIRAAKPAFTEKDGKVNLNYFSQLSDYLSDRLFLRQEAITVRNRLSTALFLTAPNDKVALGRGGRLFYAEPLEAEPLSEKELWCASENLRLLEEAARSRGSEFLFVLCPNKSSLCADMFSSARLTDDGLHLEEKLRDMGVSHSSLYSALSFHEEYFYKFDSHWNGIGAAVAADAIFSDLGRRTNYAGGHFTQGSGHVGDLSEMIYPAAPDVETDWLYPFSFRYTSDYRAPNDPLITTEGSGEGSLYCYRDSFGNDLHPYLAEGFQTATFSRKAAFDLTGLDADLLLIELVERNIDYLYRYDHVYPAPERSLSAATKNAEAVSVRLTAAGTLVRVSGSLDGFDPAPIYIKTGGRLYECAPKSDGYTVCLPEFDGEGTIIYQLDGQYYAAQLVRSEE